MSTAPPPKPATVAFDLGGVLVDVDHGAAARALGVPLEDIERAFFAGGIHDAVTVGALDGAGFTQAAARALRREPAVVEAAWAAIVNVRADGRALAEECLAAGLAVVWWSNTDPIHLAKMARALPRVPLDHVSFALGAQKPDPEFFRRGLARLGARPVFVDDRADNVAAARALGIRAHVVKGPGEARAALVREGLLPVL
ncbi:MAG: HAD-IA family hydrolase [Deltaproteobacteria bacterium]|nr:HAD-IA family hydrolase [Deltaproteobacteria bacterium]